MQIFFTMHHFYLPIKLSAPYLKRNMISAILIIELILPLKCYISREYFHKKMLKILKIANFMNFLVKNVVFRVIFLHFFKYVKIKKIIMEPMRPCLRIFKDCSEFCLSQNNQLWAYSNHLKWLGCCTPQSNSNFLEVFRLILILFIFLSGKPIMKI